ncbi:MAG TPA: VOC family protein [Bacteroidales bacterium]|nr:VOC family protein [Bacteroidales bacterium]
MNTNVKPIPEGYTAITPYLSVINASAAIEFYKKAFGAKEIGRISMPDGSVAHADLEINGARFMLAEENKEWGNLSPQSLGGTASGICLYVENVDEVYFRALREGAKTEGDMEVKDQYYGERSGNVIDPFGHKWMIMTHIKDVSFEEMQQLTNEMFAVNKEA